MKKLVLVCLFACSALPAFAQKTIDVIHYRFSVDLNDQNDTIRCMARIKFVALQPLKSIELDLTSLNSAKKGMIVTQVLYDPFSSSLLDFRQANEKLTIQVNPLKANDTSVVTIYYKGIPADGLIISKNKYGRRTFFADNWPNRGHNWLPCIDNPADKAGVEFIVTAPDHYQVVANGVQVEETNLEGSRKLTHWKEEVPVSTKVMVIGVADFAVNLSGMVNDSIPVTSWVYPEDKQKGFFDYAQAAEILPFYIEKVGPYGYKKLANVESKTIFGGLENANTIFYSESSITGTRRSETLIAHEIAHQWFGNMATEKTFAHLWLSEGFATYMTILYMENKYGEDTARFMREEDRSQVIGFVKGSKRTVVDNDPDYMQLLNANSYQKGGWVLHMLRVELGDSVFWKGIRHYYATYAGKTADTDDFRKAMEQVSGKDLSTFFKQWLYTPGIPELDIEWEYQQTEKRFAITIEQKQTGVLFDIPFEIVYRTPTSRFFPASFRVTKQKETFYIERESSPRQVIADPNANLLYKGTIREKKK